MADTRTRWEIALFVSAAALANISIAHFGPSAAPANAFVLIGLNLTIRDDLHDKWSGVGLFLRMFAMIVSAGVLSYLADRSSSRIAMASVAALILSGVADTVAYHFFRKKKFLVRSNASNVAGAAADSLAFFWLAFGSVPIAVFAAQWAVKVFGGGLWSLAIARFRK